MHNESNIDFSGPFLFNFNCIVDWRQFALIFAHRRFLALQVLDGAAIVVSKCFDYLIEGAYESDQVGLSRFLQFIRVFSVNHNPRYVVVRRIQTFCASAHIMLKLVAFRPL